MIFDQNKESLLSIDIVTNLGPPAHLSIFLPPPGTLVRMHRAYLVRLAEVLLEFSTLSELALDSL